jgi:hypothetical protein
MSDGCMCEWPKTCDGMGSVSCRGCGGDLCVCICGGESECYGCEDCFGADDDDYPDDNPTDLANE